MKRPGGMREAIKLSFEPSFWPSLAGRLGDYVGEFGVKFESLQDRVKVI